MDDKLTLPCETCQGHGEVIDPIRPHTAVTCPACSGRGVILNPEAVERAKRVMYRGAEAALAAALGWT